ncbi:MAG: excinuclease ABC subunit UvrA [Bacteroidota bacterium]
MKVFDESKTDPKKEIIIKNARVHNLKNLSVAIPRNKCVVITGLSGSGKSSLAYDTLYAEGQRRYVESLSSYARQFLGRMAKPEVDYIKGISPAIAIEQKVRTHNPRSTVGTSTEIYDYIKLMFARIGKTYSPVSGKVVSRDEVSSVVDYILKFPVNTKVIICCPVNLHNGRSLKDQLSILMQQGFTRIAVNGETLTIEDALEQLAKLKQRKDINLIIDRVVINSDDENLAARLGDSVQTAFYEGHGSCTVKSELEGTSDSRQFSDRYERDGITFEEPSVNLFSFNNPYGACRTCEGFGSIIGIDEDLVVPDKSLSIFEEAIACWRGEKMSEWKDELVMHAYKFDFPIHKPFFQLKEAQRQLLWTGNKYFKGLNDFFKFVEEQAYKIQYRVMLSRYRGKTNCPDCRGTRLRSDAAYVQVAGKNIVEILTMPIDKVLEYYNKLQLEPYEMKICKRLLPEILNRLKYLDDVGLGYLTLHRASNSLSGGESQRINLATALGSSLVGSMYILDEPSVGLHPRDTHRLIKVLHHLRDMGNTVIIVEHDEDIIRNCDQVIDIGPEAGAHGGEVTFQGTCEEMIAEGESLTARYLNKDLVIENPAGRRPWRYSISVHGARENNLKNVTVSFPLNVLTVVTGVSGSGKTSLVKRVFYAALKKIHGGYSEKTGHYDRLDGDINRVTAVELVDQNPIGRSSRSNPVTYIKAYDDIRSLFADQQLSKVRGYKPGYFSFNIEGGRCEECQGDGFVKIEMQFMADIFLKCESCGGKRFKDEVLDVTWHDKNITEILDLTVDEAIEFFQHDTDKPGHDNKICDRLKPLADVGLGYVKLGQPSSTLSGGEAQRLKLAYFLSKGANESPTIFIFDEPTTGLHFHDINKLYKAFQALIEIGHTIIVIEHNMDIIKCADWIIDMGPEGGNAGGTVVCEGTPEDIVKSSKSYTGEFLKAKL